MAQHIITLNDGQEATLAYAARKAGSTPQFLIRGAVEAVLSAAAGDLNQRVDRVMEALDLPPMMRQQTRDRILRALTGEPEPAPAQIRAEQEPAVVTAKVEERKP